MCKPGYTEIPQSKQSGCAAADVAERTERRKPGDYGGQDIAGPVFTASANRLSISVQADTEL